MEFEKIIKQATKLRKAKNSDYGDSFIRTYHKYGNSPLFFELQRKFDRAEVLLMLKPKGDIENETIEDTLMDLGIACFNGIICLRSDLNVKKTKRNKPANKGMQEMSPA
ncbi:hypothetical protein A3K72_00585 [Candidatus Woesearchaeota archaeon RBG_13_36_6]|nr:MAG: hypothetical protein A3K72_00585 [Candidatus Woesearchaeota archaeon RBG_13_36_6]